MIEKTWPAMEKLLLNALNSMEQLFRQLVQEADVLNKSPDTEAIDNIAAVKKNLVLLLDQFNMQFGQILATEKLPLNQEGIEQYFQLAEAAHLPVAQSIINWAQIQSLCSDSKRLNERNGATIELLACHTKRSLQILKGSLSGANTYGPDGTAQNGPFIKHSLISI